MSQLSKNNQSWLIILLVFFMAVSVFFLPQFLSSTMTLINRSPLSAGGANSKITLPANLTVSGGSSFSVPVNIDTDNASIQKVDVVIHFDRQKLTLKDINPVASDNTNLKVFTPQDKSGLFDKTNVLKQANHRGSVSFSASSSPSQPFSGITILAILTFVPSQIGKTDVSFVFTSGQIGDTDFLVDSTHDILASVTNLVVTVEATATSIYQPEKVQGSGGLVGDINSDGVVDKKDEQLLLQDFGKTGTPGFSKADLNNDGKVDLLDRSILYKNFGENK